MNGDSYSSRDRHTSSRDQPSSRRDEHRGDRDRRERRRSRSPPSHRDRGERGGERGSRREYEVDSYSSSRNYREREREDRYKGGREDREWGRDRGSARERGSDDRPPRRDRDLFEDRGARGDRRGGGDRGGPDRSNDATQPRKKSATPPPKPKEPTPDLTDIPSVLVKKRRMTQWDIKPPGYDNVTAEQAKISGMFPLPGAPRQQPMDQQRLQAFMANTAGSANDAALRPSNSRLAKRAFVYNIPASIDDAALTEFFNLHLNGLNVVSGVDPCIGAQIAKNREYGLLEFKQPEDTTVALALDGISMEDSNMQNGDAANATKGLSIRRPKDYIVPSATDEEEGGSVPGGVRDSPNKISITNIPIYLSDEQVNELLMAFGDLKAFVLVKDSGTEQSKGIAFCEYADPEKTDEAVSGLDDMELGEQHLKVQRASIGSTQVGGTEMSVGAMSLLAGTTSDSLEQGRVLQLLNMVTAEELMDNDEYAEICADVKEECEKYGKVEEMKMPRPAGGSRQSPGVGKIFVKYDSNESAQKALQALAGRKFADRTVVVTFFGEEYFNLNAW